MGNPVMELPFQFVIYAIFTSLHKTLQQMYDLGFSKSPQALDFIGFICPNSSSSGIVLESHISSYNVLKHPYEATFDQMNIPELLKSSYKFAMKCRKFCRNFVVKLSQPKFTLKIRKTF